MTYGLNAAKPVMQIQVTEAPLNIFIMLSVFHIEMDYFKVIGKLIGESGWPNLLTDTCISSRFTQWVYHRETF